MSITQLYLKQRKLITKYFGLPPEKSATIRTTRYDTIAEFNVDSKAGDLPKGRDGLLHSANTEVNDTIRQLVAAERVYVTSDLTAEVAVS